MHEKALLRQRALRQRASLSPAKVHAKSAMIAVYVCRLQYFCSSHTLMVYMALPQEVQTLCLIEEARRQQKRIVVPVIAAHGLVAVELLPNTTLHANAYGILEPNDTSTRVDPMDIDCVVVPGVAFDCQGGRIGFGKGYYDRFLSKVLATTYLCGVAFTVQIVPDIPQMSHDVRMHVLVTEQGPLPCSSFPPTS
jgi:5-formyltetrahydrofolate cyclo-ligase